MRISDWSSDVCSSDLKLIAEPWDIGMGGYQVGNFPAGWAEWNDRYRDTVRRFWKSDEGQTAELASRITGSSDLFDKKGRRHWSSINFLTAHDGFRSEEHTSELQSLMSISYAVFCCTKNNRSYTTP